MEAVDQPWKRATEGRVGAFWGLRDAWREPKFEFSGPVYADPYWFGKAALSSVIALAALLPFLLRFATLRLPGRITFALALQAVASFVVLLAALPLDQYLRTWDVVLLMWLVPALALMGAILLAQVFEFAELFWDGSLSERAAPRPLPAHEPAPFVSIHLACCNEPPEMVIETIDSLLELDWPVFEVLVVDNNTSDASRWQPVRDHVEAIQARSRRDAGAAPRGPEIEDDDLALIIGEADIGAREVFHGEVGRDDSSGEGGGRGGGVSGRERQPAGGNEAGAGEERTEGGAFHGDLIFRKKQPARAGAG
jgi:hypothetical protein